MSSEQISLFISTFTLIFLAELPDKTAFAALILATRKKPSAVLIGVCIAFTVQSLIAVCLGDLFKLLPEGFTQAVAAGLFIFFGIQMWFQKEKEEEAEGKAVAGAKGKKDSYLKAVWSSFLVIFMAEWGDLTQLSTAAWVARNGHPVLIFFAATLALWAVTFIVVGIGSKMNRFINPKTLQKVASVAFFGVGVFLLVKQFVAS